MYYGLYGMLLVLAVGYVVDPLSVLVLGGPRDSQEIAQSVNSIGTGLSLSIPAVVVILAGRDRLFALATARFEQDPATTERDGSFVATLLLSQRATPGQPYWIHRLPDQFDMSFPVLDHRRYWRQGHL